MAKEEDSMRYFTHHSERGIELDKHVLNRAHAGRDFITKNPATSSGSNS